MQDDIVAQLVAVCKEAQVEIYAAQVGLESVKRKLIAIVAKAKRGSNRE